jgi:hypothetical protein
LLSCAEKTKLAGKREPAKAQTVAAAITAESQAVMMEPLFALHGAVKSGMPRQNGTSHHSKKTTTTAGLKAVPTQIVCSALIALQLRGVS